MATGGVDLRFQEQLTAVPLPFGAHDGLAIVDAPDSLTMAGVSAAITSTGTVRGETYELFSTADIRTILETAQRARQSFTEPGS